MSNISPAPRQLLLVSQAKKALAEAKSIAEIKEIRDKAAAMKKYLLLRDDSREAQNAAAEIKLLAERRAGEFLRETPRAPFPAIAGGHKQPAELTLSELGVKKDQSRKWQAIASIPEPAFTEHIEATKTAGKEITTGAVMKMAQEIKLEERREAKRADLLTRSKDAPPSLRWQVVHGDCLHALRDMEARSVRLAFADPPYNIGVDYGDHDDTMEAGVYLDWCQSWIKAVVRTLTPDGSFWVLINDEWADELGCMLRRAGLHRRAWIKWYESFGVNSPKNFNRTSRHLFYMVNDPNRFVFNREAVTRPSDRQAIYGDKRAVAGGKTWDDVWGINPPIPRLAGTFKERIPDFPTQLPLDLLRAVVGCASDPDDLVIDPFNGSGTTGVAAIELGRRYLGIEKSAEFADLAAKRLSTI